MMVSVSTPPSGLDIVVRLDASYLPQAQALVAEDMVCYRGGDSDTSSRSSNSNSSNSRNSSNSSDQSDSAESEIGFLCDFRCVRSFTSGNHPVFSMGLLHDGLVCAGLGNNTISVWRQSDATHVTTLKTKLRVGAVRSLLVAGDKLFSAHHDKKIRVWRLSKFNHSQHTLVATLPTFKDLVAETTSSRLSRKERSVRVQHTDAVSALALGDGVVYSASWDTTVKVWRLADLKCLESFVAHDDAVQALVAGAGHLFTASADSNIKMWRRDASTSKSKCHGHRSRHLLARVLERPEGSPRVINALALGGDGSESDVLYSGSSDSCIAVWKLDLKDNVCMEGVLRGHSRSVICLATLHDLLCSGSADNTIRLWRRDRLVTHTCLAVLGGHSGPVKSIALSSDRIGLCNIFSGSLDGQARMWRISPFEQRLLPNRESKHFYFGSSDPLTTGDDTGEAPQWRINTIKHALDEGARFFHLAFDTLQG